MNPSGNQTLKKPLRDLFLKILLIIGIWSYAILLVDITWTSVAVTGVICFIASVFILFSKKLINTRDKQWKWSPCIIGAVFLNATLSYTFYRRILECYRIGTEYYRYGRTGLVLDGIEVIAYSLKMGDAQLFLSLSILLFIVVSVSAFIVLPFLVTENEIQNDNSKRKKLVLISAIFILLLFTVFHKTYYTGVLGIDSYLIANVTGEVFDSYNICQFVHPALCALIKALNRILPMSDNFTLIQVLGVFLATVIVFCLFYHLSKNAKQMIFPSIVLLWMVIQYDILYANFTVAAAYFTCVGAMICVSVIAEKTNMILFLPGIAFMLLGHGWRVEAFELMCPFLFLMIFSLLCQKIKDGKLTKKCIFLCSGICIMVFIMIAGSMISVTETEESRYNSARTSLVDYPVHGYENISEELTALGISENDYNAICNWVLFDTDIVTVEKLESIAKLQEGIRQNERTQIIAKSSELVAIWSSTIGFIVFVWIIAFSTANDRIRQLALIFAICGMICLVLYFTFIKNRTQLRVISSIEIGFLFTCLWMILDKEYCSREESSAKLLALVLALSAFCSFQKSFSLPQNILQAKNCEEYQSIADNISEECFYVWDVGTFDALSSAYSSQGKLLPKELIDNNIVDGDWMYGQTYYKNYMKSIGVENPAKNLLDDENCYYVGRDWRKNVVLQWLQEHYDPSVTAVKIKQLSDNDEATSIWRFIKHE